MKQLKFIGSSLKDLTNFPREVRRVAGQELLKVQNGNEPSDWKPMSTIGIGVREIRVKDETGQFRIIYYTKIHDMVCVLHAFQKKTQKTPLRDIELAKKRLSEL